MALRTAELLGSLSLATDLSDGFALEKCLRTAVLACRLGEVVGASEAERRTTFWASLLRFTGCTAFAHEEGQLYGAGDDIGLRRTLAMVDFGRPASFLGRALGGVARHAALPARAAALGRLLTNPAVPRYHADAQCEAGASFARAVGMPDVAAVLALRGERWDGRGPRGVARETELPLAARLCDVADVAELFAWHHGGEAALGELARRRGGELDPALVDAFVREAGGLFAGLFAPSIWEVFLASEPGPHAVAASAEEVTRCLGAFARLADLGSVYTLGHSARVAELAAAAAVDDDERALVRDAGYVHDVGRVAIPNGIWEKRGPLSPYERERVRSHSQHTETVLRLAPALAPLADVAAATHERGAGAGYHRRLRIDGVSTAARLIAAADVWVALTSERPQRPAFTADAAERELRTMAEDGALDRTAVAAVLMASGQSLRPAIWPRGLSEREVEVVRLVAIGRTNREIGQLLGISPRTAQKHVMNVYGKLGLESRAGLALFAMEHHLLD